MTNFQPDQPKKHSKERDALSELMLSAPAALPLDFTTSRGLVDEQLRLANRPISELIDHEVAAGQAIDPRVCREQELEMQRISEAAQLRLLHDVALRQQHPEGAVLFAVTSRLVDHLMGRRGFEVLIQHLCASGREQELRNAVESGPQNGGVIWERPADVIELAAGILRQGFIKPEEKKRIRCSDGIRQELATILKDAGCETFPRLGGVSVVGSSLAGVLGRKPTMLTLGALPEEVLSHVDGALAVITEDEAVTRLDQVPLDKGCPGNYCLSFYEETLELPPTLSSFVVNGQPRALDSIKKIDVIVTGTQMQPGFGQVGVERMRTIGAAHGAMVLTGLQAIASEAELDDFVEHVRIGHEAGMGVALLYSESKYPELEVLAWKKLRDARCVEFIGLNTVEAYDVLFRIAESVHAENPLGVSSQQAARIEATLRLGEIESSPWGGGKEDAAWVLHSAQLLREILEVPLVRVRAKASDVLLVDSSVAVSDEEGVRDHQLVSRHLATLKVANSSGLIDKIEELGLVCTVPEGAYLALLHRLDDELAKDRASAGRGVDAQAKSLAMSCMSRLADGTRIFAVPPAQFLVRAGGTQSAGDYMDVTLVTEEMNGLLGAAWGHNNLLNIAQKSGSDDSKSTD